MLWSESEKTANGDVKLLVRAVTPSTLAQTARQWRPGSPWCRGSAQAWRWITGKRPGVLFSTNSYTWCSVFSDTVKFLLGSPPWVPSFNPLLPHRSSPPPPHPLHTPIKFLFLSIFLVSSPHNKSTPCSSQSPFLLPLHPTQIKFLFPTVSLVSSLHKSTSTNISCPPHPHPPFNSHHIPPPN